MLDAETLKRYKLMDNLSYAITYLSGILMGLVLSDIVRYFK